MKKIKKVNKGFTLAELLIVVAIVAVLVAVAIPVFNAQLEKSREAKDLSAVRHAYSEVVMAAIHEDTSSPLYDSTTKEYTLIVDLVQKKSGWESDKEIVIGDVSSVKNAGSTWKGSPKADGTCKVFYDTKNHSKVISWDGYTLEMNYQWGYETINGKKILGLIDRSVAGGWPCNAIPEFIDVNGNSTLKLNGITDSYLLGESKKGYSYQIGYFLIDPETKEILHDSGRIPLSSSSDKTIDLKTDFYSKGKEVQIAIQVFKVNSNGQGSSAISEKEARQLENMFSIGKK